jgi:hypothetical protein
MMISIGSSPAEAADAGEAGIGGRWKCTRAAGLRLKWLCEAA